MSLIDSIIAAAVILAPVLVYTGLGGLIHQRSGVVNIALEGLILIGAFAGIITADATSSGLLGVLVGALAGAAFGWMFSAIVTRFEANEIIVGLGFNTIALGLVGLILGEVFGSRSAFRPSSALEVPGFGLTFLADVPILGPLLGEHDVLVWATVPTVFATGWLLSNTRWGLRLRAAGGDANAATSLGISVAGVRDRAGLIAGALAGLGGAHLAIVVAGLFSSGISAGRGYIALAAVYFGRGRPVATTVASLIYVVVDAAQSRVQLRLPDIPVPLIQALPYLAVIIALTLSNIRARQPEKN